MKLVDSNTSGKASYNTVSRAASERLREPDLSRPGQRPTLQARRSSRGEQGTASSLYNQQSCKTTLRPRNPNPQAK
jgi:hypothetical protein